MFRLHVIQACQGDCLMLEYGTGAKPRYILIDGGPETVYEDHLRQHLLKIRDRGGNLDLAIVSHVDDDHIFGVLQMMSELQQQRKEGKKETIGVKELWHNSFSQTLGSDIETRFRAWNAGLAPRRGGALRLSDRRDRSIKQGDELTRDVGALQIPLNPEFPASHLICLDDAPINLGFGNLHLHIVGPTQKNLKALKKKWLEWLAEQEKKKRLRSPARAAEAAKLADESIPNLSSIMVLAEYAGKTMLLPGDGTGNDLLKGLDQAHLLNADKTLKVDLIKLPHHGSQRNVTRKFFQTVTADQYVISANGMYNNPDFNTLKWLVETAKEQGRSIKIYITNATDSTRQLLEQYPPAQYGYRLVGIKPGEDSIVL